MFQVLKEHGAVLKQCSDETSALRNSFRKIRLLSISSLKIFLALAFTIVSFNCVSSRYLQKFSNLKISEQSPTIRVLLDEQEAKYEFISAQSLNLFDANKKLAVIGKGNSLSFKTEADDLYLQIGSKQFVSDIFIIRVEDSNGISFNGKKYSGEFVIKNFAGKILLVNRLPIEDYLRGVLPLEMGIKYKENHSEALKAFAITARTFCLMRIAQNKPEFDVYADTRDQLYGGIFPNNSFESDAITHTRGEVLGFEEELAKIFYHSNCGGFTENIEEVFNPTKISYLISQRDGENFYCSDAKNYSWSESFSAEEINSIIANKFAADLNSTILNEVVIDSKTNSGRVKKITFKFGNDSVYYLEGREIRNAFRQKHNNGILRSLLFEIEVIKNDGAISKLIISGRGSGHGVGLCQWGCIFRSEAGQNYQQILSHYFTGTKIYKIYE